MNFKEIYNMDFEEANKEANEIYNEQEVAFVDTVQNLYSFGDQAGVALVVTIISLPLLFIMKILVIIHNICNSAINKLGNLTEKYLA